MMMKKLILSILICSLALYLNAQKTDLNSSVKNLLLEQQEGWKLTDRDISEFAITDAYTSKHNGVTHVYFQQLHEGIPVFNAISNFNIKGGKLLIGNNNHIIDLESKINANKPQITPVQALERIAVALDIKYDKLPSVKKKNSQIENTFNQASFTKSEIPVNLVYYQDKSGKIHLAWNIELQMSTTSDYWNGIVDATDGKLIKNNNQTLYCKFSEDAYGRADGCRDHNHTHSLPRVMPPAASVADGATYRVYPLPIESPIHGVRSLVESPAYEFASPFGWHDTNGVAGPEFTITRGNNVRAYEDSMDENSSQSNEPDGGEDLIFDFSLIPNAEPDSIMDAVITNLFYVSNYVHDWSYYYGFDEQSGNFQVNNYGNGGRDNDDVQVNGLDGEDVGNANFSITRDGSKSFLQMYKWNGGAGTTFLNVDSPAKISGAVETGECSFCPTIGSAPTTGKVVVTSDAAGNRGDGCDEILNFNDVAGNVALIDRGGCNFVDKVFNAEQAGAIAVIVCNYENSLSNMGRPGGDMQTFGIPGLFLERRDCESIRASIIEGEEVQLTFQAITPNTSGPSQLPGSFDNGIIAHEYGHGISGRLTGGPNSVCLFNDEQMGEGWSDFVTLVLTHEPGDKGTDLRGIGNYVQTSDLLGRGIRRKPYSTDLNINNHTYNSIRSNSLVPHNLGEVWATMLWDLYWAFVEEYGFNPDWTDKESGNYKAVQLVFDGMKFQGCSPGFVRGRNGILAADEALFNGEHQCMIWDVFAKRGLGFFADEGSSDNRNDNEENYDLLPGCIKEITMTKEMTEVIDAGNDIKVKLTVVNNKEEQVTGTSITDIIPDGASYKAGSANVEAIVDGNTLVLSVGQLNSLGQKEVRYELETNVDKSGSLLIDDFEEGTSQLTGFPIKNGLVEWRITDEVAFKGSSAQFIPNDTTELDQGLVTIQPLRVQGGRPTLSFRHMYDTEYFFDGGIVEVSTNGGLQFDYLPEDLFLKGGYDTELDYFTFALPNTRGFSGDSKGWRSSYIDLSDYIGQEILIRFRFGCDDSPVTFDPDRPNQRLNEVPKENTGWYVDNFEIVDLSFLDGNMAVLTTSEGDRAEAKDITIVNTEFTTPTNEVLLEHKFLVFPNPAQESVTVNFISQLASQGKLQLLDMQGKLLKSESISIRSANSHTVDVKDVPAGIYLIQVVTDGYLLTEKLIIEN